MYKHMWFGTREKMQWIPVPRSGFDVTHGGYEESGVLMSGGAYSTFSNDTHARDNFVWSDGSTQEFAQEIKAYRQGVYGTGPIYYINPRLYDENILPARWASPGITAEIGTRSPAGPGKNPTLVPNDSDYGPAYGARFTYTLQDSAINTSNPNWNAPGQLTIPIPPGYSLSVQVVQPEDSPTTGGVYYRRIYATQTPHQGYSFRFMDNDVYNFPHLETGSGASVAFVQMALGKVGVTTNVSFDIYGMRAWYTKGYSDQPHVPRHQDIWVPGTGHTGMAFEGMPTQIMHSAAQGGQNSVSANFVEVGAWQ